MRRTDLMDVSPEMHRRIVEILRTKSPTWRIQKALVLSQELRAFVNAVQKREPR
jgi:hypothetical protein